MTSKRQPRRRSVSSAKLDEMIEEATVDAYSYGWDKMLAIARRTAKTHQRKALADVEGA